MTRQNRPAFKYQLISVFKGSEREHTVIQSDEFRIVARARDQFSRNPAYSDRTYRIDEAMYSRMQDKWVPVRRNIATPLDI